MQFNKLNKVVILGAMAFLVVSCSNESVSTTSEEVPSPAETLETPASPTTAQSPESPEATEESSLTALFVGADHPTQGTVTVVEENGRQVVKLDEAFKTDDGPALFVLLHREEVPESYNEDNYVNLGQLQSVSGSQSYEVPEGIAVEDYSSVVVWCRQFNVTFGYASFGS